ncbi:MAG: AAA family ATPase [Spirochaetaceae bacterium]|jgi:exonuclease SbcC|nr:AAA family ATPase [Spirochaetaceae bacterium]
MRPVSLRAANFGPFAGEAYLDFTGLDDIFLITGKTGSGKTSIFDAICFALYGKVPGSRGDHLTRLKSDYAGEDGACFVMFDFSVGTETYRVERAPKQETPKKRGGGMMTLEEKAALYRVAPDGLLESLNTKKSEADNRIRALIGLDAEEFFRIVLLPQGEFAEFLRQNTLGRQKSLGKLFPVENAEKVKVLALEKARSAGAETAAALRTLEELHGRVKSAGEGELREKAETALRAARERAARLAETAEILRANLAAREEAAEIRSRIRAVDEEAARAGREDIPGKEEALRRARAARPLGELLNREEERKKDEAAAENELEKALRDRAEAEARAAEMESRAGEIDALEAEKAELARKKERYAELIEEEKKLFRAEEEAELLRGRIAAVRAETDSLKKRSAAREEEIKRLEERTRGAEALERRREAAGVIREKLVALKKVAAAGEAALREERQSRERAALLEAASLELGARLPALEAELAALKAEKETAAHAEQAALLAADLKHGEPCPVCGSREHPDPAAAHPRVFGLAERIDALEYAVRDAREQYAARKTEREGARRDLEKETGRLAELLANQAELKAGFPAVTGGTGYGDAGYGDAGYGDDDGGEIAAYFSRIQTLSGVEETARLLEAHIARLNALVNEHETVRRDAARLAELRREEIPAQKSIAERETELAALSEQHRHAGLAAEEIRDRRGLVLGPHDGVTDAGSRAGQTPEAVLAETERRILHAGETVRRYREEKEALMVRFASARTRAESCRAKHDEILARRMEAEAALRAALEQSPFTGGAELRAALLEDGAFTALEETLTRHREEAARRESLKAELLRSLETARGKIAVITGNSDAVAGNDDAGNGDAARLEEVEERRRAAEAERDRAAGELAALERDAALLDAAGERYEHLARQSGKLAALSDDLSGRNPKKKSFDAWLLGRYLEEVAAYATRRLERMSEGRYSLLLDSGAGTGNARAGLDLAVFDAHTGKCRPCATLSGGESFMASISLALGLADSIQNRSGGVRLDAVFIDEGFGSLDETTLDLALLILDEIKEQRMVALISHVGELRTRIPSRVEVVKGPGGSRIRDGGAAASGQERDL